MTLHKIIGASLIAAAFAAPSFAQETPTEMKHDKMDHSQMDHGDMDHGDMDHGSMDHSKMDHSNHDMSAMAQDEPVTAMTSDASITAKVNGLVCDFCAQALRKVFKKEEAVNNILVDLDKGHVLIALKPGQTLEDERVMKLIRKSGYSLVSIERNGGA